MTLIRNQQIKKPSCIPFRFILKALYLPDVEPQNKRTIDCDISVPKINFGQYDHYWEVFEPYQFEQPLVGSLADDTLGIYKDVQLGILLYDKGESIDAIWEYRLKLP